jgi:hypothetical protein
MYKKKGYNPSPIGTQKHDVTMVEVALEHGHIVIHLCLSVLVPIYLNKNRVAFGKFKNENRTRIDLGFTDPNPNLSKEFFKKLGDDWVPHSHSFIVGNRVYSMGDTNQGDQGKYSGIIQDITGIRYDGDLELFSARLNKFFETHQLYVGWSIFVPKDENIAASRWFIGPSGENMSIHKKSTKAQEIKSVSSLSL